MGFRSSFCLLGCLLWGLPGGDSASNGRLYSGGLNGEDLCNEPDHKNGGAVTPIYNYASDGSDWKGLCQTGALQSPIDLSGKNGSNLHVVQNTSHLITFGSIVAQGNAVMRLEVDEVELISGTWNRSGFTIPVCGATLNDIGCLTSADTAVVEHITPNISNLHFHANAEHTLDGLYYGAEAHLVTNLTISGKSHLVVFGVWMDISGNQTNQLYSTLQPYVDSSSGADCAPVPDNVTFDVSSLFPSNKSYYAYSGSLTTPPCSEGVTWVVFTTPVKMSIPQLKSLYQASAHISQPCAPNSSNQVCNVFGARTNNRPLQAPNGRPISYGKASTISS